MTQKTHYAQKAAKKFLRGTSFSSPQEAIDAGYRTNEQWEEFMRGETAKFWRQNGQKARRKVKGRHPVKRVKGGPKSAKNGQFLFPKETFGDKKREADRLALQKRAEEWGQIGGSAQARIDKQARQAYVLYLDFARHALAGDFPRWLSQHSGIPHLTCWKRLRAGTALELGLTNRNQSGLLAEMRERKNTAQTEVV